MSNSGSNSSTTPRAVNRNKRKFKPKVNMFHKINNHSIINYLGAGIIGKFLQNPKLFGCFSVDRSQAPRTELYVWRISIQRKIPNIQRGKNTKEKLFQHWLKLLPLHLPIILCYHLVRTEELAVSIISNPKIHGWLRIPILVTLFLHYFHSKIILINSITILKKVNVCFAPYLYLP